jgi:isocitrate/isopropylmalate dehydrogenase
MTRTITVIPGDGIGPEVTQAVLQIMETADADLQYDRRLAGVSALEELNSPLPDETLESIRRNGVALKGPLATPLGGGFRSVNVAIRKEFDLYANVRPAKTLLPGGRYEDIDLVLLRENTEGLYVGVEHFIGMDGDPKAAAESVMIVTRFDVLVMENMFGDILSDLMAGLVGGLGMAPAGNIGDDAAMFKRSMGRHRTSPGRGLPILPPFSWLPAWCWTTWVRRRLRIGSGMRWRRRSRVESACPGTSGEALPPRSTPRR